MQVAAPPIPSESSSATADFAFTELPPEDRAKMMMEQYREIADQSRTKRTPGEMTREKKEQDERKLLHEQWVAEKMRKAKEEQKGKEAAAVMPHYNPIASQPPKESRKRRAEDDPPHPNGQFAKQFAEMPNPMMQGMPGQHQWPQQMQQHHPQYPSSMYQPNPMMMQQQHLHQQQQHQHQQYMMQQQQQHQQQLQGMPMIPGAMMQQQQPQAAEGYPYPPCSTGPSTSTSDGFPPSDPAPFNQSSPAVVPSCSAGSSATPPQGQVPNDQLPTPPALNGGNPPDDMIGLSNEEFASVQHLLNNSANETLMDLGALGEDVFDSLGDDFQQPSTSSGGGETDQQKPVVRGTPNSVVSPDGFQMPVNGPHSVQSTHSQQNPMSNGGMKAPVTPTNGATQASLVQQHHQQTQIGQQQYQQNPLGAPLFSSTPKGGGGGQQQMNPMAQMQQMNGHSPMVPMSSPLMAQQQQQVHQQQTMQSMTSPMQQQQPNTMGQQPQMPTMPQQMQMPPAYSAQAPQMPSQQMPAQMAPHHPSMYPSPYPTPDMMGAMPTMPVRPPTAMPMPQHMPPMTQQQYYMWMQQQQQQRAMQMMQMNPHQMQQMHMQHMQAMQHREMQRRMMAQAQQQQMRYPQGMMDPMAMMANRMPAAAAAAPSPSFAQGYPPMYPSSYQMH